MCIFLQEIKYQVFVFLAFLAYKVYECDPGFTNQTQLYEILTQELESQEGEVGGLFLFGGHHGSAKLRAWPSSGVVHT